MTRRYYHPELPFAGGIVSLSEQESQHALRVMRIQIGDEIELFDGCGREAIATVCEVNRRECHCQAGSPSQIDREPNVRIHLGVALPKPDRARELIERLTELGVHALTPIIAARSQRPPSPSLISKLRRAVIEACKQSRRNVLMQIHDPLKANEATKLASEATTKWIAHPDGELISQVKHPMNEGVFALIGPEGGWTDDEVANAEEAGFTKIGMGQRIYRVETAAVVVAARLTD